MPYKVHLILGGTHREPNFGGHKEVYKWISLTGQLLLTQKGVQVTSICLQVEYMAYQFNHRIWVT